MLFKEVTKAEKQKHLIDSTGCGHACSRRHEVVAAREVGS